MDPALYSDEEWAELFAKRWNETLTSPSAEGQHARNRLSVTMDRQFGMERSDRIMTLALWRLERFPA